MFLFGKFIMVLSMLFLGLSKSFTFLGYGSHSPTFSHMQQVLIRYLDFLLMSMKFDSCSNLSYLEGKASSFLKYVFVLLGGCRVTFCSKA